MSDSSTVLLVLNCVLGVFAVIAAGAMITLGVVILERLKVLRDIAMRVENVEDYLRDLSSEVNNASSTTSSTPIYRSMDGKHTAASLEELVQKMMADPSSGISQNSSPEELKKFFDQLSQDDDDDDPKWK